jgi:hypothetical protein
MNLPVQRKRFPGGPVALAIAGLATGLAFGQPGARTNEPAPEKSAIVATNASRPESRKLKDDLFKRKLTEDLFRSFQRPGDSLGGMVSPPPQNRINLTPEQTRKLKELRDRDKYWLFLSPDEYKRDQTPGEELQNDDPNALLLNLRSSPVLERFYRSLDRSRPAGTNAGRENPFRSRDDEEKGHEEFGLDARGSRSEARTAATDPIKAIYEASAPKEMRVIIPEFFPDIFMPSPIPLMRTDAEKERLSEFNKILEGNKPSAAYQSPLASPSGMGGGDLVSGGSSAGLNSLSGAGGFVGHRSDSMVGGFITKPLGASSLPIVQPSEPAIPMFTPITPPRRRF